MLRLYWTPAQGGGVPAETRWQASEDLLRADGPATTPLQSFRRGQDALPQAAPAVAARLSAWVRHRSTSAPLTIMVHGFQYDPRAAVQPGTDNPFSLIYGVPGPGVAGQLSFLPLVGECGEQGGTPADVAVAFSWLSDGTLRDYGDACWNSNYQLAVLDLAPLAAKALAAVIAGLSALGTPIHILAHSLGTRVVGQAVGLLRAQHVATTIARVVLLGGAEFCVDAAACFDGCGFDVVNVASRVDTVLRVGAEQACHPVRQNGTQAACVIGRNGLGANRRWFDLQLDAPRVVGALAAAHVPTKVPYQVSAIPSDNVHADANLAHWAYYTNPGNRQLVRDLVQHPAMTCANLVAAGVPNGVASAMYGLFHGLAVPPTPDTCAARRGSTLVAQDATTLTG